MTKKVKHEERAHAIKSPSSWERLLNCPASLKASEGMPHQTHIAAKIGTYGHEIGERCIKDPKRMKKIVDDMTSSRNLPDYVPKHQVDDLRVHPKNYAEYVLKVKDRLQPYRFEIEEKMHFSEDVWGIADVALAYNREDGDGVAVIDYKHGSGFSVEAKDNPQLIIYALGFSQKMGIEPTATTCIVYQPRVFGEQAVRKHTYTWDEMVAWRERIQKHSKLLDSVMKGSKKNMIFEAGKWCAFCAFKPRCRKHVDSINALGILDV